MIISGLPVEALDGVQNISHFSKFPLPRTGTVD